MPISGSPIRPDLPHPPIRGFVLRLTLSLQVLVAYSKLTLDKYFVPRPLQITCGLQGQKEQKLQPLVTRRIVT